MSKRSNESVHCPYCNYTVNGQIYIPTIARIARECGKGCCLSRQNVFAQGWVKCCSKLYSPERIVEHRASGDCPFWCNSCSKEVKDVGMHKCPEKNNLRGTCSLCHKDCFNVAHRTCKPNESSVLICSCGDQVPLNCSHEHIKGCQALQSWVSAISSDTPKNLKELLVYLRDECFFLELQGLDDPTLKCIHEVINERFELEAPPDNWYDWRAFLDVANSPAAAKEGQPFYVRNFIAYKGFCAGEEGEASGSGHH